MKDNDDSLTIKEFCRGEKISVSGYYNLERAGKGPEKYRVGRLWRITQRARDKWRAERLAASVKAAQ